MKRKIIIRVAATLLLIHLLGHGVGHFSWDKPEDPQMMAVVAAMKDNKAEFMGSVKSMADYYNGYSLMIFGIFAMSVYMLWVISGFHSNHKQLANQLLYPVGTTYILFGIIEYLFFFPFAALMSFFAGLLIIYSAVFSKA